MYQYRHQPELKFAHAVRAAENSPITVLAQAQPLGNQGNAGWLMVAEMPRRHAEQIGTQLLDHLTATVHGFKPEQLARRRAELVGRALVAADCYPETALDRTPAGFAATVAVWHGRTLGMTHFGGNQAMMLEPRGTTSIVPPGNGPSRDGCPNIRDYTPAGDATLVIANRGFWGQSGSMATAVDRSIRGAQQQRRDLTTIANGLAEAGQRNRGSTGVALLRITATGAR